MLKSCWCLSLWENIGKAKNTVELTTTCLEYCGYDVTELYCNVARCGRVLLREHTGYIKLDQCNLIFLEIRLKSEQ